MVTTAIGRAAEKSVADFLAAKGYKILDRNWRTRWCEIDVIAQKGKVLYFIEVKYRHVDSQGDGFAYLTHAKLKQMRFAADVWTESNSWRGDCRLLAASVRGNKPYQIEIVEVE
ncbi:MAG TPA: YraN family protein [Candidatus Saccharimonadales bacterium]|nr:YraN family protein [Candidatus Saccharimonadales bacterium]